MLVIERAYVRDLVGVRYKWGDDGFGVGELGPSDSPLGEGALPVHDPDVVAVDPQVGDENARVVLDNTVRVEQGAGRDVKHP